MTGIETGTLHYSGVRTTEPSISIFTDYIAPITTSIHYG